MRESMIQVSPFQLLDILSFDGKQQVNEHGRISFSGHILEEHVEQCLAIAQQPNPLVQIMIKEEEGEGKLFFAGVLTEMEIKMENQLKVLSATVLSGSYLMDLIPHIRSFQAESWSYGNIIRSLNVGYEIADVSMNTGEGDTITGLVLQYRESDWTFAKRMASRFGTVLIASGQSGYPAYDFGINQQEPRKEIESATYTMAKDLGMLLNNRGRGRWGQTESDVVSYRYQSRDAYNLGECVLFNRQPLYITSIETKLLGGELYHTYSLTPATGLLVPEEYNQDVIGVSLAGRITAVQQASVKIAIDKDENTEAGSRPFAYATVYSSPDGTGWYCMPEIGDAARLYVPSEQEAQAYVASSVHKTPTTSTSRSNPNYKSICNKQGKEVKFMPDGLVVTNNKGMYIELMDAEGIKFVSDKAITIQSEEEVNIISANSSVLVLAPEEVSLKQGSAEIQMKDEMNLKGAQVHME